MNAAEDKTTRPGARKARLAGAAGLIAAGAVVGGVLASGGGALAASSSGTASPSTTTTTTTQPSTPATGAAAPATGAAAPAAGTTAPAQSSTPVRTDEKATTDSIAATVKTKALAAVPGGTVYRIESDAGDGAYEAHMTKSDGTLVTVKFDKNLAVTGVETGMGQGDPAPAGGPGRGPGDGSTGVPGTAGAAGTSA
jgi:hypothetical protein